MNIVLTTKTLSAPGAAGRISITIGRLLRLTNDNASGKVIQRRCSSASQDGERAVPGAVYRGALEVRNSAQRR
jgi:hypothetical protein